MKNYRDFINMHNQIESTIIRNLETDEQGDARLAKRRELSKEKQHVRPIMQRQAKLPKRDSDQNRKPSKTHEQRQAKLPERKMRDQKRKAETDKTC